MQRDLDHSLNYISSTLLSAYFYQGWFEFEPEPFDIGYTDGSKSGIMSVERKLGILSALLNLDLPDEAFDALLKRLGVEYRTVPGEATIREIITDLHAGMLKALTEKTLALVNDSGELS